MVRMGLVAASARKAEGRAADLKSEAMLSDLSMEVFAQMNWAGQRGEKLKDQSI